MAVGAKIAKTADRKKVMDTTKSTDCPKCSKPTRIVKRMKDRERNIPGGIYISCSGCDFFAKLEAVLVSARRASARLLLCAGDLREDVFRGLGWVGGGGDGASDDEVSGARF